MVHRLKHPPSPPVLRRARVLAVSAELAHVKLLEGPLAGETVPGLFYLDVGPPPVAGEVVVVNTVCLEMTLGTGGYEDIVPSLDGSA